MLIQRFYHEGLAQASYLIGCQKTGEAIVIDANRDANQYVAAASREGLRVTHVTETHIHADYLSGSRELAACTGAQLLLSGAGGRDWQYAFAAGDGARLLADGDQFMVGRLHFDVVHTPGHTPEHLTLVLTDTPASSQPVGAFTGDFLFVGDVGRPDLLERAANLGGTMRTSAAQLHQSLERFVATYPDYLQLWPGHGSGSACGKALGAVPQSTLGYEKIANWALQIDTESDFIESVLDGQPDPPPYFSTMKQLNRDGPALLGHLPAPDHRAPAQVDAAIASGALLLDIRRADVAANRFIPGTLNIPLNKSFVGWAGWFVGYDRDVYLVTDDSDERTARAAAAELAMIGIDRVAGWFGSDTFTHWASSGRPFDAIPQVDVATLDGWLAKDEASVLDVRATSEWDAGHIEGARLAPLGRVAESLSSLAGGRMLVMQCQGGGRSAIASSLARLRGVQQVANLRGGFSAWQDAQLPVARDASAVSA